MGALLVHRMIWVARKDHDVAILDTDAVACSAALLTQGYWNRLIVLLLLTAGAWVIGCGSRISFGVACGFAAAVPDATKHLVEWFDDFHCLMHYRGTDDLGYWINRLFGQDDPDWFGARATRWTYLAGYTLELALEAILLVGGLWRLTRPRPINE